MLRRWSRLMELARRYDVYVILTSWEYQDSSWFVADPAIRAEVMAVPQDERLMHLARQHDRLLGVLKAKGLDRQIAFVEVHNEPDCSLFPQGEEGRRLHEEAIAFLRERHGDILVSADYTGHNPAVVPANSQVYDQHLYVGSRLYFQELYEKTIWVKSFDPASPRNVPLLDRLLKDTIVPWDRFMAAAGGIREWWRPIMWLYHNIDNARFDEWIGELYADQRDAIDANARQVMGVDAAEAARRGIPAVCDEGGYFYPPLGSRFEVTQSGLRLFERMIDLAIEFGYWGFMPSTYCGPEHPLWNEVEWLRRHNGRFLGS